MQPSVHNTQQARAALGEALSLGTSAWVISLESSFASPVVGKGKPGRQHCIAIATSKSGQEETKVASLVGSRRATASEGRLTSVGAASRLPRYHPGMVRKAKRLARANPKTGERRSLRKIAAELAKIAKTLADTGHARAEETARLLRP